MSDRTPPGIPNKPQKGPLVGCLVVMGVILVAFAGCTVASFANGDDYDGNNEHEAIAQCEGRIENLLKSPATASYDSAATASSGEWTVTGTFDSEIGFGANVRFSYQCTVVIHEDTATTTVDYLE